MLMVGVSTKPPFGGLFRGRGSLSGTQTSYEGTAANISPLPKPNRIRRWQLLLFVWQPSVTFYRQATPAGKLRAIRLTH